MSTTQTDPVTNSPMQTPSSKDRVHRSLELRIDEARRDASVPAPKQIDNGDEARYADKCGTYTKGIKQAALGRVDLAAYSTFRRALDSGKPDDFDHMTLGGPRTLNGPQGGLAFQLDCLDNSQFNSPPAPPLASEAYAAELVELYWASLLRDVAFTEYGSNNIALMAAAELSALPSYAGPKNNANQVTTDLLFRGGFPGETAGPYLSQFLLRDTVLGALPITQKYLTNMANMDFMSDEHTFQLVQNGQPTSGISLNQLTSPSYLHDGRGLAAYTYVDVLYQAYFTAYLVLNTINGGKPAPLNPGNPYSGNKTQNGFATFGQPDIAATLVTAASAALKAVWYQKWFVHLRHRPESGGGIVHLSKTPSAGSVDGKLNPTVLNSKAVETSVATNKSYFLSQAFPEGSPTHPAYPTGHGAVAGACITVLKFFVDGGFVIQNVVEPSSDGAIVSDKNTHTGTDGGLLTVNGELNKLAHNISFGHGIHAGIHWRSDTDTSIQLGEAVTLSLLQDLAHTYNEKFSVQLQKVDGAMATISNH
jgi:hypothetical protein